MLAIPMYDQGVALNMILLLRRRPRAFSHEQFPEIVWMSNLFGRATSHLLTSDRLKEAYEEVDYEMKTVAAIQRSLAWLIDRAPEALEAQIDGTEPVIALNLTILSALIGTPLMPDLSGHVLMLEEVSEHLYAIDPRREMWALARHRLSHVPFPVEFVEASAERIPMNDRSVDTVVTTWTLCSIPDPRLAVLEMARLLRSGGQLLFVEHGRAPDPGIVAWQDRLNPLWKRIAGGCNLNRKIDTLLLEGGFHREFDAMDG